MKKICLIIFSSIFLMEFFKYKFREFFLLESTETYAIYI